MKQSCCIEIKNLSVQITNGQEMLHPLKKVFLKVPTGKIIGIVGESGSGKSMLARSILGLADIQNKNIRCSGEIWFEGMDLMTLSVSQMRSLRGAKISLVLQDPMTALNPVLPILWQLQELFTTHRGYSKKEAKKESIAILHKVGLPKPETLSYRFPHQLSGGMRQRVMIAMALALKPALIIADEPTTALDVTLQAQILTELKSLQKEYGVTILLISHDMSVIAEMADEVAVMRQGEIIEYNDCCTLFDQPKHEYTKRLILASRLEENDDKKWSSNRYVEN